MTDPIRIAREYFDAWNRHDPEALLATFTADGTYSDPAANELSGEDIAGYARGLWESFPDLIFEVEEPSATPAGMVAAQWRMTGTNRGPFQGLPPSERTVTLPGADFIQVEGDRIRSVQGYFDAGELPRQLGMQVLTQPDSVGPYRFGTAAAVQSGKKVKPGAFSVTKIQARNQEEVERNRQFGREIAGEMLEMPGFIGWTGLIIGNSLLTVTAWEDAESPRHLLRKGSHVEAMKTFFGPDFAAGGYTSVWTPERFNATWVRCPHCDRMSDYEAGSGRCECGRELPEPPPYW